MTGMNYLISYYLKRANHGLNTFFKYTNTTDFNSITTLVSQIRAKIHAWELMDSSESYFSGYLSQFYYSVLSDHPGTDLFQFIIFLAQVCWPFGTSLVWFKTRSHKNAQCFLMLKRLKGTPYYCPDKWGHRTHIHPAPPICSRFLKQALQCWMPQWISPLHWTPAASG